MNIYNVKFLFSILEGIDFGLSSYIIQDRVNGNFVKNNYSLNGAVLTFSLFQTKRVNRGFLETGIYLGNYCLCGENLPYKESGLKYLNLGAGYEHRIISDNLFIKLYAHKLFILNNKDKASSYIYPQLGITYKYEKN
jgi:hypothetical protein